MKRLTRSRTKDEGGQLESLSFAVKKRKCDKDEIEPKKELKNNGPSQHNPSTSTSSSFEGNGQNNSNNTNEEEELEEHLCTKQFNILKHIFQYLPIGDLTRAAQVSILWSDVGRVVRRQRLNHPYVMIYHGPFPGDNMTTTKELVDYFNTKLPPGGYRPRGPSKGGGCHGWLSTIGSSPAFPIDNQIEKLNLDYPSSWNPRKLLKYVDEFEPALWNSFQSHWEPQVVLCIGTTTVGGYRWSWNQQGMRSHMLARVEHQKAVLGENHKMSEHEALFGRMEKVVPCIGVLGPGLLTTLPDDSGTTELEHPRLPMMASLAIPKFPGLRVKVITFGSNNYQKYKQKYSVNKDTCERILNISDGDNVKGIVLFVTRPDTDHRVPVLLRVVKNYLKINPGIGVGGGLVSDCYSSKVIKSNPTVHGCGLVFCCDDNVQVGVSVMTEPGMTSENEKQIMKFKEAGMDRDTVCSFAIVFASKERGLKMHKHEDAETSMFRRHYPNTPIIGAFTGSEWSHEYIPGQENISGEPDEPIFEEKKGSSVFFFVSCKKPASSY